MFIGHFAPAFVAASLDHHARGPKLATYFIAAQLTDWVFFTFAWIGIEKMRILPGATELVPYDLYYMPFSHSLVGAAFWALVMMAVVFTFTRNAFGTVLSGLIVLSHWALDWLVHRPDLTLAGGEAKIGFGLWNEPMIEIPLEIGIVVLAFAFYVSRTRGPIVPPLVLLGALLVFQAINWFGPEPAQAGPLLYGQALLAYGIATALAVWVGANRYFVRRGGLAISGV